MWPKIALKEAQLIPWYCFNKLKVIYFPQGMWDHNTIRICLSDTSHILCRFIKDLKSLISLSPRVISSQHKRVSARIIKYLIFKQNLNMEQKCAYFSRSLSKYFCVSPHDADLCPYKSTGYCILEICGIVNKQMVTYYNLRNIFWSSVFRMNMSCIDCPLASMCESTCKNVKLAL